MKERESFNFISDVVGAPRCTSVAVYTSEYVFRGDIHHAVSERLLDVLNQGSVEDQPDLPPGFLLLTEVEIFSGTNRTSSVSNCVLNKSAILLVGEEHLDQAEPPPIPHYRSSLFTPKKPVRVNILMPTVTLVGHMHVIEWQRSMSAVDTEQLFLPLTTARVLYPSAAEDTEFEFAAVNKSRVIALVEARNA